MPDPERSEHIFEGLKLRSNGMSYGAIAKDRKEVGLVSNTKLSKPITKGLVDTFRIYDEQQLSVI